MENALSLPKSRTRSMSRRSTASRRAPGNAMSLRKSRTGSMSRKSAASRRSACTQSGDHHSNLKKRSTRKSLNSGQPMTKNSHSRELSDRGEVKSVGKKVKWVDAIAKAYQFLKTKDPKKRFVKKFIPVGKGSEGKLLHKIALAIRDGRSDSELLDILESS